MGNSNNSLTTEESPGQPANSFNSIWERWGKQQAWRQKLEEQATRKALDIPDDDMKIDVDRSVTNTGLSSLGALGLGLGAAVLGGGIPTALMLGAGLLNKLTPSQSTAESTKTLESIKSIEKIPDKDYRIRFFDEDMKPVPVDQAPAFTPSKKEE